MEKRTLKFNCLIEMARFSQLVSVGYLMNTNNFTLTAKFSDVETELAMARYNAAVIKTSDKVYSYESVL